MRGEEGRKWAWRERGKEKWVWRGERVYKNNYLPLLYYYICFRMSAAIAMGVMDFNTVLSNCILFTMSQAWQLGRAVSRARTTHNSMIDAVIEQQNGILLITGKVYR